MLNLNNLLFGNSVSHSTNDNQTKCINTQSLIQAIIDDFMLVENIYIHFTPSDCEVYPSRTKIKIDKITVQSLHETQTIKPPCDIYTYINKIVKPTHSQLVYSATQESFRSESGEIIKYYPYALK